MGLARWFFNDWFTAHELDRVDERFEHAMESSSARQQRLEEQVKDLRADLARLALLSRSLAEVCIHNGVLTHDELKRQMLALDGLDGREDGGLDPRASQPDGNRPR